MRPRFEYRLTYNPAQSNQSASSFVRKLWEFQGYRRAYLLPDAPVPPLKYDPDQDYFNLHKVLLIKTKLPGHVDVTDYMRELQYYLKTGHPTPIGAADFLGYLKDQTKVQAITPQGLILPTSGVSPDLIDQLVEEAPTRDYVSVYRWSLDRQLALLRGLWLNHEISSSLTFDSPEVLRLLASSQRIHHLQIDSLFGKPMGLLIHRSHWDLVDYIKNSPSTSSRVFNL